MQMKSLAWREVWTLILHSSARLMHACNPASPTMWSIWSHSGARREATSAASRASSCQFHHGCRTRCSHLIKRAWRHQLACLSMLMHSMRRAEAWTSFNWIVLQQEYIRSCHQIFSELVIQEFALQALCGGTISKKAGLHNQRWSFLPSGMQTPQVLHGNCMAFSTCRMAAQLPCKSKAQQAYPQGGTGLAN